MSGRILQAERQCWGRSSRDVGYQHHCDSNGQQSKLRPLEGPVFFEIWLDVQQPTKDPGGSCQEAGSETLEHMGDCDSEARRAELSMITKLNLAA